jgi:hypothetical protein
MAATGEVPLADWCVATDAGRASGCSYFPQLSRRACHGRAFNTHTESIMRSLFRTIARTAAFACASLASGAALGQVQVLDSVDAFGSTPVPGTTSTTGAVLEMGFREGRPRDADFERLAIAATPILACQRGLDQGVVCVVGTTIRYWPDTDDVRTGSSGAYIPYFNAVDCKDSALKLDNRRPNSCTGVTVDADGAFWVAGRKANSHSLFKVVAKDKLDVSCTAAGPWVPLTAPTQTSPELPSSPVPTYCAREFAFGRPTLEDVNTVDFVAAATFLDEGPAKWTWGVIGLEKREGVSFFPDSGNGSGPLLAPVEIVKTKSDWGLANKDTLTTATLLQVDDGTAKKDYVLAVSSFGRVLALEIDEFGQRKLPENLNHREVFRFPANRTNGARQCVDDSTQVFGIRVSQQSRRVYISDRNCGQVVALEWRTKPAECGDKPLCLVNAKEPVTTGSSSTTDVTLSTVDSSTNLSPVGVSVVQGVGYNLAADCGYDENGNPKTCAFVGDTDANGYNAAQISGVKVDDNGRSAMTVYQVIDIPDCRDNTDETGHPTTDAPCNVGGIVDGDGYGYLNVYPLLPPVVQDQIPVTELWISPRYRGQVNEKPDSQYKGKRTIDLFFGVTEPGVRFRDTFEGLFDVDDLNDGTNNGNDLGCAGTPFTQNGQKPDLSWDAIVTVSEKVNTVKPGVADAPGRYDVLVSTGCFNPDGVAGARWSLYAYHLEPFDEDFKDSYYVTFLRELLADLRESQEEFACKNVDIDDLTGQTPANAPLALSTCSSLTSKWNLAKRFLDSCVTDATYPKKDQAVSNCNSFNSQVAGYRAILEDPDAPIPFGLDPANRVGELILRTKVLQYIYENHFLPSIPPLGFCDLPGVTSCQR